MTKLIMFLDPCQENPKSYENQNDTKYKLNNPTNYADTAVAY